MAQGTSNIYGSTKGAAEVAANTAGQEQQALFNARGDFLTAASLPPYAEIVRLGNTWSMKLATASAFNFVAAAPTTLAEAVLYNGEAAGGKSYVIHQMAVYNIVSTAALTPLTLLAQVLPNPGGASVAPTHSATTTLLWSNSGKASYTGLAKRAAAVTLGFTNYWGAVASGTGAATANIAGGVVADIGGSIIIPPGGMLAMNVIAGTVATAAGIIGCTWSEVQLTLG